MKLKHLVAVLLLGAAAVTVAATGLSSVENTDKQNTTLSQDYPPMNEIEKKLSEAIRSADGPTAFMELMLKVNVMGRDDNYTASDLLDTLRVNALRMPPAARSLVYSFMGDFLREYWDRGQWIIEGRTSAEIDDKDIDTWDTQRLFSESLKYYRMSVEDAGAAREVPLSVYSDVLYYFDENNVSVLPTLYDFLVTRAADAMKGRLSAATPARAFVIDDPAYFDDADRFSRNEIVTPDSLSSDYNVLRLYRDLLAFRLSQYASGSDPKGVNSLYALVNADIERLRFVKANGNYGNADELYEKALVSMADKYKEKPESGYPLYELAVLYNRLGSTGEERYAKYYEEAYRLCERIQRDFPGTAPASNAKYLALNIAAPEFQLTTDSGQIPGESGLALAQYRNIEEVYVQVYEFADKSNSNSYTGLSTEKSFNAMKRVAVQKLSVPRAEGYRRSSAEVALDLLPQGYYLVLVSEKPVEKFSDIIQGGMLATTFITVSPLAIAYRGLPPAAGDGSVGELSVYDRKSGRPVPGAKFEYWEYNYNKRDGGGNYKEEYKGSHTADDQGIVKLKFDGSYRSFVRGTVTSPGGGKLSLFALDGWGEGRYYYRSDNEVRGAAVIFTDRAIYRPGQTVYYKVLTYASSNGERKVPAESDATVGLYDVNGQLVASQKVKTGEFGTASGSFVIPQGLLNGAMSIRASGSFEMPQPGDDPKAANIRKVYSSYNGYVSIRVEEYKRPTFEVVFDPVKGNYRLGDHVEVSGKATALAGYAVDNAAVKYNVVRTERYRFYYWWMPPIVSGERQIASGELSTGDDGAFTIAFDAAADDIRNTERIYDYRITADITDVSGETRSATMQLHLGANPVVVETNLPDRIADRSSLGFRLATANLNGDPTPAEVRVTVSELAGPGRILRTRKWQAPQAAAMDKDEFVRKFPNDPYMDEDKPSSYRVGRKVTEVSVRTLGESLRADNLDLGMLAGEPAGWYRLDFSAVAGEGVAVTESRYVQLFGEPTERGGKSAPSAITSMDQWLTPVITRVEPGSYAEYEVAGAREGTVVRYDVFFNNSIIDRRTIEVGPVPQKVRIPVKEEHRGGMAVQFVMLQDGRAYIRNEIIMVPYSDKMIDVEFLTFRDKLQPGQQETWKLRLKGRNGEKVTAEMVAALYDASLDAIAPHGWVQGESFYPQRPSYLPSWYTDRLFRATATGYYRYSIPGFSAYAASYPRLNTFGYDYTYSFRGGYGRTRMVMYKSQVSEAMEESVVTGITMDSRVFSESVDRLSADELVLNEERDSSALPEPAPTAQSAPETQDRGEIALRENFNETAFFYPELRTDENGDITIEFTIPEALTRWRMLGFAHTKEMKVGSATNTLITQKDVAISANAPRFFREGDRMEFTAKVNNVSEAGITGEAELKLFDAVTMKPIDAVMLQSSQKVAFSVPQGQSTGVSWTIAVPAGLQAVTYQLTAKAGDHTDGEQKTVPVMINTMLVTETMPFYVRGGETKEVIFDKMKNHDSNTLRDYRYTLEFTSNPAWYAVQAMPYLMEYPYECAEQVFSRFYANSLSSAIVNSTPKIKEVFEAWSQLPGSEALYSNLQKNEELKQVLLEETPWVVQATSESESKKRLGLLLDLNRMAREQRSAVNKLKKYQYGHGGFPWFDKLPADRFITQHIVAGVEHLRKLNALDGEFARECESMVSKARGFLDVELRKDYESLLESAKKHKNFDMADQHISYVQLHYLYASSFSAHKPSGKQRLEAFDYYYGQALKYWKEFNLYGQALAALVFERYGDKAASAEIIAKIRSEAQRSDEMGMYWRENVYGYFWYQAPIETQALLIEAFDEIAKDSKSVEEMKVWMLRNKQTASWRTTKATAQACYALLMTGSKLLDQSELLEVAVGGKPLADAAAEPLRVEAGTGYVKTTWMQEDIKRDMADVTVTNPNSSGIAWGGLCWQYFEQLDKITSAETNLRMEKELFVKKVTDRGEVLESLKNRKLKVGDLVTVRLVLRADRAFEYVHLKDMRGAAFEPVNALSGYRHQDGLWYYESIKDASTNFFIGHMPKGTYVFEYDLRVTHSGDFSNGITTFQCMYAPEFSAHSSGIRFKVE